MLSNAQQKYIQSLHQKKYRNIHNAFLVEGRKNVKELQGFDFDIIMLLCSKSFKSELNIDYQKKCIDVSEKELDKVSTLKKSDQVIAVVKQKENSTFNYLQNQGLVVVLDNINDPGNLGTIIRTADWYGIKTIICSNSSVEFYNPKVIMSTMGSFGRVNVIYTDLIKLFEDNKGIPVLGAFLEGTPAKEFNGFGRGFLLMGSETHGINESLKPFVTNKITIPKIGNAESLNVAISTAILIDNLIKTK